MGMVLVPLWMTRRTSEAWQELGRVSGMENVPPPQVSGVSIVPLLLSRSFLVFVVGCL